MADTYTIIAGSGSYDDKRNLYVDCSGFLGDDETLVTDAGPPVYPFADTSTGLTIVSTTVGGANKEINGKDVATGQWLLLAVDAVTAGTYEVTLYLKTNSTPAQEPIMRITIIVIA